MTLENNEQKPQESFIFNSDFAKRHASLLKKELNLTNEQEEILTRLGTKQDQELQAREFAADNKNKPKPGEFGARIARNCQYNQQTGESNFFK